MTFRDSLDISSGIDVEHVEKWLGWSGVTELAQCGSGSSFAAKIVWPSESAFSASWAAARTGARSLCSRTSFSEAGQRLLDSLEVGENEFGVDRLDVVFRRDRALDVHHIGSANARITWQIASASRMWARNLLPRPAPSLAPFTMPAMSTNDTVAGMILAEPKILASTSSRGSGTPTTPTFGSMVAKG